MSRLYVTKYLFETVESGQIIYGFNESPIGHIAHKCNATYLNLVHVVN